MAASDGGSGVRLIKRYANRKLYDTGSGELTSMRRIEELVHSGVEIKVVDHDTGEDMTGEVLVGILGNSVSDRTVEADVLLLSALIRDPGDVMRALALDAQQAEDLKAMRERVRLLSATMDALLNQMEPSGGSTPEEKPKPKAKPAPATRAKKASATRSSATRSASPRLPGDPRSRTRRTGA